MKIYIGGKYKTKNGKKVIITDFYNGLSCIFIGKIKEYDGINTASGSWKNDGKRNYFFNGDNWDLISEWTIKDDIKYLFKKWFKYYGKYNKF